MSVAATLFVLTSLVAAPAESTAAPRYVDMHVHVAGIGAGDSGAFINEQMRDNFRFRFYLNAMGVSMKQVQQHGDQLIVQQLSQSLAQSARVSHAVVLALDGVIDPDTGQLDRDRTQVYVPSEFVAAETAKYDNLLFGASINPARPDALERLEWAKANGAVLVKWLPAIMDIDPADPALIPFYEKLVELDLPLLSHAGQERAFPGTHDEYGDPLRLELPLKCGVRVIAAHLATTGDYDGQPSFARVLPLFERYPNFYSEISSLTQINKLGYLADALEIEGIEQRLLYGTDWPLANIPLMAHPAYHANHIGLKQVWQTTRINNPWDQDVALKQAIGVPQAIFTNSARVLGITNSP